MDVGWLLFPGRNEYVFVIIHEPATRLLCKCRRTTRHVRFDQTRNFWSTGKFEQEGKKNKSSQTKNGNEVGMWIWWGTRYNWLFPSVFNLCRLNRLTQRNGRWSRSIEKNTTFRMDVVPNVNGLFHIDLYLHQLIRRDRRHDRLSPPCTVCRAVLHYLSRGRSILGSSRFNIRKLFLSQITSGYPFTPIYIIICRS